MQELEKLNKLVHQDYKFNLDDFALWTLYPKFTFIEIKNVHDDLVLESDPNLFFSQSFNFITHGFSKISQKQTHQDTFFLNNVIPEFKLVLNSTHLSAQTKILKHIIIMHKVNEYIKKQNVIPNLEIKNYE